MRISAFVVLSLGTKPVLVLRSNHEQNKAIRVLWAMLTMMTGDLAK